MNDRLHGYTVAKKSLRNGTRAQGRITGACRGRRNSTADQQPLRLMRFLLSQLRDKSATVCQRLSFLEHDIIMLCIIIWEKIAPSVGRIISAWLCIGCRLGSERPVFWHFYVERFGQRCFDEALIAVPCVCFGRSCFLLISLENNMGVIQIRYVKVGKSLELNIV